MFAPTPADVETAYTFACECQAALTAFIEPDDAIQVFDAIHRALRSCPDTLSAVYMSSVAMAVVGFGRQIARLAATARLDCAPAPSSTRERVCAALRHVLAWHNRRSLTVADIAESLCVSAAYLSDSINRLSQHGFFEHLHAVRVLHAAALLAETSDSPYTIAQRVGYLNAQHLNSHFWT